MEFRYDLPERRLRIRTPFPMAREPRVFAHEELFRFGIEEEYFLSDSETFAAPAETPDALFHSADCCTMINRHSLRCNISRVQFVATLPAFAG
jgi:hypothetical protein